jgi:uncharacterized OB-fold protein
MTTDASRLQPVVSPSPEAAPFWDAAERHRLELPYCTACSAAFFYPRPLCPTCGGRDTGWVEARGTGTLYSFCVHYRSSVPGLTDAVPFVTALVDLDEGPRLMSFLVDAPADPEAIRCGIRVEAEFLDLADGHTVVAFKPSPNGSDDESRRD